MGRVIPFPVRVAVPDPREGYCTDPVRFEATAGAVGLTLGERENTQERWLPPRQAREWAQWLLSMADTAERLETEAERA